SNSSNSDQLMSQVLYFEQRKIKLLNEITLLTNQRDDLESQNEQYLDDIDRFKDVKNDLNKDNQSIEIYNK
ncbi:hypothetical protein MHK_010667, partial [Candidatus Magnetomorum sp. HK-1]